MAETGLYDVTPHAGVRIEIGIRSRPTAPKPSPPTRGCELKFCKLKMNAVCAVTPHAGVRIEVSLMT